MAPSFDDDSKELFDFVVKNGNGVKGLVDSGITKVPNRYVQPSHERIEKLYSTKEDYSVAIDLSKLDGPNHGEVVEAIGKAAERIGFFQVVNHGVPLQLLAALKATAHKFFNQPPEAKAVYLKEVSPSPLVKYGTSFLPEKEKVLEWRDKVGMVYTSDSDAQEQWPKECKEESLEYLKTSMKMVRRILEILFEYMGVEVESSKVESLIGFKKVNMNFYPICPNPELTVGVGRHSDMGTLTILLQDGNGGLHVKVEEDSKAAAGNKKEEWVEIPPLEGALVINVGDALQILSNGKYKSAEHRVRTTSKQSRVSVPIFTAPSPTEKIAPLPQLTERDGVARYREIIFQDYMNNYFGKGHEGKKSLDFAKISSA